MSDEGRYNMLSAVAAGLGLEDKTAAEAALWRDAAILALNQVHIMASCAGPVVLEHPVWSGQALLTLQGH